MRATAAIAMGFAAGLVACPALAQLGSSSGSSAAGGIGGTSGVGGIGGVGSSSFGSSGIDDSGFSAPPGAVDPSVLDPVQPDASLGAGGGSDLDARAMDADSAINATTVEGLSPPGNGGTAATSTLSGGGDAFRSTMDRGQPQVDQIRMPTVEVDLGAIRRAMAAGPSATPKWNGD
jgi:hypothetical protein